MARTVFCQKLQKEAEGLAFQLYPGEVGEKIFNNISKEAWQEWQHKHTMLINEKQLNMMDKEARKYLNEQRDKYLAGEPVDHAEGYVPTQND